jgi:hypothetical protein
VWERSYRNARDARRCTGNRRGYVGVVPDDCRTATSVTEVLRACRLVLAACGRRADHVANVNEAIGWYLARTDYKTLQARPGHDDVLEHTRLTKRTLQRCLDTIHELGLLITEEEGTTPWVRRARLHGQDDPHQDQNRAEVYRWCIPLWVAPLLASPSADPPGQPGRTLSGTPSRPSLKEKAGSTPSRRKAPTGTYARARNQRCHRRSASPQAAGRPAHRPQRLGRRRARPSWQNRAADVAAVWRTLPRALTERLAGHEADRLAAAIADQLTHRTVAELSDRITRHWDYWRYKLAADLVRSPIAIAHRILRRGFDDCPDVRCEDRWQLDTDQPCKACEDRAHQVITARNAARTPPRSAEPRPARFHRPGDCGQAVCSAHGAFHISETLAARPTPAPGTAERGAALARRLLAERLPYLRRRIADQGPSGGQWPLPLPRT